ncbi:MAG: hypothetical protein JST00_22395 [Deltaproteobacteria bacterium]|nr:hypothetical protein [Deltaproteobacteria bacterium]
MNLVDELHAVARALSGANVRYAICGGIAVTIHGATRTTKDIDILVARGDLPHALAAVRTVGYEYAALPMTFEAGTPKERHVQRVTKLEDQQTLVVDFLLEEAAFAGMLDGRVEIALAEGVLTVVSRDTLLRMKRLAGRDQDRADIEKLEAGDEE